MVYILTYVFGVKSDENKKSYSYIALLVSIYRFGYKILKPWI